jgi:hypothetical protein
MFAVTHHTIHANMNYESLVKTKESSLMRGARQILRISQTDHLSVVGMNFSIGLLTVESWLCSFCSLDFWTLSDHFRTGCATLWIMIDI